jgi:hypothetical protein
MIECSRFSRATITALTWSGYERVVVDCNQFDPSALTPSPGTAK